MDELKLFVPSHIELSIQNSFNSDKWKKEKRKSGELRRRKLVSNTDSNSIQLRPPLPFENVTMDGLLERDRPLLNMVRLVAAT